MAKVLSTINGFCHSLKCGVNEVTRNDIHKLTSCNVALLEAYYPFIRSMLAKVKTPITSSKFNKSDSNVTTNTTDDNNNNSNNNVTIDDLIKLANCYLYNRSDHFLYIVSALEQLVFTTPTSSTHTNMNVNALHKLTFAQVASLVQLMQHARLVSGTACNVTLIDKISERIGDLLKQDNKSGITLS